MKNKVYGRAFMPILVVFLAFLIVILLGTPVWREWNTDPQVLMAGNDLFFALTAISYLLHIRSLRTRNPHAFVRSIYGSLIIKMLVCMIAALLYGWLSKTVNKNAIFGSFILYVVYTFMEVRILTKFIKKSPNDAQERSAA